MAAETAAWALAAVAEGADDGNGWLDKVGAGTGLDGFVAARGEGVGTVVGLESGAGAQPTSVRNSINTVNLRSMRPPAPILTQ